MMGLLLALAMGLIFGAKWAGITLLFLIMWAVIDHAKK